MVTNVFLNTFYLLDMVYFTISSIYMVSILIFNLSLNFHILFTFLIDFTKKFLNKINIFSLSMHNYFVKLLRSCSTVKYNQCLLLSSIENFG